MNRRAFVKCVSMQTAFLTSSFLLPSCVSLRAQEARIPFIKTAQGKEWLDQWEKAILGETQNKHGKVAMGEDLGWLVSPYINGFYHGYLATRDPKWMQMLVEWADTFVQSGVKEPDGYFGWPMGDGGGGESREYSADSLLGEAMILRPISLAAGEILKTPGLKEKWGAKAQTYLSVAEQTFQKWDSRACWREVKNGGVWVVPAFGIDLKSGKWSAGYADRATTGFTNPDNKENHIAAWMLAMFDVTGKNIYRERAEKWFQLMKSRMKTRDNGKYFVWNYWDPAGPWDFKPDGSTRHWVGVHPNGGYYQIDVDTIICAYEHGLVFTKADIDRLIATNRDYMWNQKLEQAQFQRIDGEQPDPRRSAVDIARAIRRNVTKSFHHEPCSWQLGRAECHAVVPFA